MSLIKDFNSFNAYATKLGCSAKKGDIYLLYGDLGVGKTTFVKAFAAARNIDPNQITSPTFNLVHIYQNEIWHYDLYRLKNIHEIHELDIEYGFENGISLIEWPNIIESILPKRAVKIMINYTKDHLNSRTIDIL